MKRPLRSWTFSEACRPDFISVTYGAGGSRSKKTVEIASYIQNTLHIDALAHMTCVGSRKEDLLSVCEELARNNISHVLALRGDRPRDMTDEQFESRDFAHCKRYDGVLKEHSNLHLAGACYPEKHFECFSMESDLQNLKRKQEAGAEFLHHTAFPLTTTLFMPSGKKPPLRELPFPSAQASCPSPRQSRSAPPFPLSGSSIPKALSDIVAAYGDSPEICARQALTTLSGR